LINNKICDDDPRAMYMRFMINGKEDCGFGSVSTSFSVNYIKDAIVADEKEKGDCIYCSAVSIGYNLFTNR
jgi:hypothetical protein